MKFRTFIGLLGLFVLPGRLAVADEKTLEARIIYTSNRQGEVADCGCQIHKVGGLERFANFVASERAQGRESAPIVLDSGDSFFPSETLNPFRKAESTLKATVIAQAYRVMGLDAMTIGERDLALGLDELRKLEQISGVPIVVSNLNDKQDKAVFKNWLILERGQKRFLILGFIDPNLVKPDLGITAISPEVAFIQILKQVEKESGTAPPDQVIVLSHLGLTEDKKIAAMKDGVMVFGSHSMDVLSAPVRVGKSAVFQPLNQGQQVGSLRWDTAKREVLSHQLVEMDSKYERKNQITKLIADMNEAIRSEMLQSRSVPTKKGERSREAFVAHPQVCKNCHSEQYEFWKKTEHASSILFLYSKNQHFDPECIGCHTLGYGDDRGFKRITHPIEVVHETPEPFVEGILKRVFSVEWFGVKPLDSRIEPQRFEKLRSRYHDEIDALEKRGEIVKNFLGVQCEHCHGNRNGHPATKRKAQPVSLDSCKTCHRPPNVTVFQPELLAKIACPRMKKGIE